MSDQFPYVRLVHSAASAVARHRILRHLYTILAADGQATEGGEDGIEGGRTRRRAAEGAGEEREGRDSRKNVLKI